jgi:hypothetical protein
MAMTTFNLDPILRQIVNAKNKKFVKELQGNGMREKRIEQILREDYHRNIYSLPIFPRAKILECKKKSLTLSRSMRKINALLKDENILDAIKEPLLKELNRLRDLYDEQEWITRLDSVKEYYGPGNPKTWKQMVGFQIRLLYEYIKPLTEFSESLNGSRDLDYKSKDVFELIKELLSVGGYVKFDSWKQVKNIYGNAKRCKESLSGQTIRETKKIKISTYEWEKIQKTS